VSLSGSRSVTTLASEGKQARLGPRGDFLNDPAVLSGRSDAIREHSRYLNRFTKVAVEVFAQALQMPKTRQLVGRWVLRIRH
jgi:hypothetical protein